MYDLNSYKVQMKGVARKANNPFNIKFTENNTWVGQEPGSLNGFCKFQSVGYGLRAGVKLLYRYIHVYGLVDIEKILERFSPRFDNKDVFDSKLDYVCRCVGLLPVTSFEGFCLLCQSIVVTECGVSFPLDYVKNCCSILNLKFKV